MRNWSGSSDDGTGAKVTTEPLAGIEEKAGLQGEVIELEDRGAGCGSEVEARHGGGEEAATAGVSSLWMRIEGRGAAEER